MQSKTFELDDKAMELYEALNEKQQLFCCFYLETFQANESAIRAGYSRTAGSHLMRNKAVKAFLKYVLDRLVVEEAVASAEEVLATKTRVMRGQMAVTENKILRGSDGSDKVVEVGVLPTVSERLRAAELMARYYKMYTDKLEGNIQGAIIISGEDKLED